MSISQDFLFTKIEIDDVQRLTLVSSISLSQHVKGIGSRAGEFSRVSAERRSSVRSTNPDEEETAARSTILPNHRAGFITRELTQSEGSNGTHDVHSPELEPDWKRNTWEALRWSVERGCTDRFDSAQVEDVQRSRRECYHPRAWWFEVCRSNLDNLI